MRWNTSDIIASLALFVSVIAIVPIIDNLRPKEIKPLSC